MFAGTTKEAKNALHVISVFLAGSCICATCNIYYSCTGFETHRLTVKPQVILSVFSIVSILRGLWGDSMGTVWQILVLCSWIN